MRHVHRVAAKCQAVSALHKTVVAPTVEIRIYPRAEHLFAFVSLLRKIRRERVAAPKLPGLIVNFDWA